MFIPETNNTRPIQPGLWDWNPQVLPWLWCPGIPEASLSAGRADPTERYLIDRGFHAMMRAMFAQACADAREKRYNLEAIAWLREHGAEFAQACGMAIREEDIEDYLAHPDRGKKKSPIRNKNQAPLF